MDSDRYWPDSSSTKRSKAPLDGGIHNVPEEIIVQILVKLPVKSLLRFRRVSKSWLALISSQHLIKAHLKRSRQDIMNYKVMLTIREGPNYFLKHCPLNLFLHEPCSVDYIKGDPECTDWVVGSCDGLICLATGDENDLFLWNPSTRQSRKLPPSNFDEGPVGFSHKRHCFGFHKSGDDYKVVSIRNVFEDTGNEHKSMVMIYSMKNDSWKSVGDFKGGVVKDDWGKFASGNLHWSSYGKLAEDSWEIISLDMESEVFGVVEQPNYMQKYCTLILGVVGECICVLCNDYENNTADLWVLKEYGVKESWTKVAILPCIDTCDLWTPLFILPNGGILFSTYEECFVVYNPKDHSTNIFEIKSINYIEDAMIYVESLVSPIATEDNGLSFFQGEKMFDAFLGPLIS